MIRYSTQPGQYSQAVKDEHSTSPTSNKVTTRDQHGLQNSPNDVSENSNNLNDPYDNDTGTD
jgi:hypothetical protein